MKNSRMDEEIQNRLNDPTWAKKIAYDVIHKDSEDNINSIFRKIQYAAAILLFSAGVSVFYQWMTSPDFGRAESSLALNQYDIAEADLLFENEEFGSELLLLGYEDMEY